MPTITLSDACYNELKAALTTPGQGLTPPVPVTMPPAQPPLEPPHNDGTASGYDTILRYSWDWSSGSGVFYTHESGSDIGTGLVSIAFVVPQNAHGMGSISIAPYPGNVSGCEREISIGGEGDFSIPFPWTRRDVDPSMQFVIGASTRFAPGLVAGMHYYINIRSHPLPGARADFVVQCSVPI